MLGFYGLVKKPIAGRSQTMKMAIVPAMSPNMLKMAQLKPIFLHRQRG
jgi:hypothetical protein